MRFKYLIILFQLLLLSQTAICQKKAEAADDDIKKTDDSKVNPNNLAISRFQINDLKTRGIIVRMKTDKNRIDAYLKSGNIKVANQLEQRVKLTSMVMEYAYITNWSYSPVYFMETQNTSKLMQQDTLIAKTFDLQRDTSIYMNHDSVYIVDYSQLTINYYDGGKSSNPTTESGTPEPGWYMVAKDHELNQLQNPMPYKAKVWGDGFGATDKLIPIVFPKDLSDSIAAYLHRYHDVNEMVHSDAKPTLFKYLTLIYDHVSIGESGGEAEGTTVSRKKLVSDEDHPSEKKIWGDPYTQAALRLNKHFIHYYCERLDKDKNILSSDELLYWWLRNPNIRYLTHLHDLEVQLKQSLDKESTFIKLH